MGVVENEDAHFDFLRPEHIKTLMLVKIRAFGAMIKTTRDKTLVLYHKRKGSSNQESKSANDQPMQEEKKQAVSSAEEESKSQAQTKIEFVEPPKIANQPSFDSGLNASGANISCNLEADVDMTDEQKPASADVKSEAAETPLVKLLEDGKEGADEEQPSGVQSKRRSRKNSSVRTQQVPDKSALDALDLNDLIRKNSGGDVDLQFYFKGKLLPQNTCFYEVSQMALKDRRRQVSKPAEIPKFDKSNPTSLFKHLMASMNRGDPMGDANMITIFYRLVERVPASQS